MVIIYEVTLYQQITNVLSSETLTSLFEAYIYNINTIIDIPGHKIRLVR